MKTSGIAGWRALALAGSLAVGAALVGCEKKDSSGPAVAPGSDETAAPAKGARAPVAPATRGGVESFALTGADVWVKADPGRVVMSKFVAGVADQLKTMGMLKLEEGKSLRDVLTGKLGLDPADIVGVTVSACVADERFTAVLATKKPVDRDDMLRRIGEAAPDKLGKIAQAGGVDIYGLPGEDANDEPVFAFPSGTMVVVGNLDDVKAGLENLKAGKTVALPDALAALVKGARADAAVTVACVVTPELLAALPGGLAQAGGEKFGSFVLAVAIDKDLGVDAKVAMRDEAAATESRNEMLEGLAGAAANPMFANPAMKPLKDLLGAVKIGGKGSDVTISVTVSSDTIVQAAMMGQMMAQMMMSGGAGMGPGMGPGFGPDMGPGGDMSGDTEAEDVWIEDEDTGDEDTGDEDTDDAEEDWFDKE